jgi:hypothetical protein
MTLLVMTAVAVLSQQTGHESGEQGSKVPDAMPAFCERGWISPWTSPRIPPTAPRAQVAEQSHQTWVESS